MERIIIEITGDASKLQSTISDLEKLGKVDKTNRESFEKTASSHKKAMQETSGAVDRLGEQFNELGRRIVAAFAVDEIVDFGKEAIDAFVESEATANKLTFAITQIGGESKVMVDKLIEQSERIQKDSIFSKDAVQQAQTALATFGLTGEQIEKLLPQITDLASASGTDLATATDRVIQGLNGQTRGLKEVGIAFKDTGSKTENLAILTEKLTKFQGASATAMETTDGKLKRLKNTYQEFKDWIGGFLIEAGSGLLDFLDVLTGKTTILDQALSKLNKHDQDQADEIVQNQIKIIEANNKTIEARRYAADVAVINAKKVVDQINAEAAAQKNLTKEQQMGIIVRTNAANDIVIKLAEYRKSLDKVNVIQDDATLGAKDHTDALKKQKDAIEALNKAMDEEADRLVKIMEEQNRLDQEMLTSNQQQINALKDQRDADAIERQKELDEGLITQEQYNADIEALDIKLANDVKAIQNKQVDDQIDTWNDMLAEQDRQIKEWQDAEKDAEEKAAEAAKERVKVLFDFLNTIASGVEDAIQANIDAIDTQMTRQKDMVEYQKVLAEQGLANDLAFEERRADELAKKKLEEQRKLKRAKELETFLNSVAKFAEDNPSSAVAKALGVLAATKAAEVIFAEEGALIGEGTNRRTRLGQMRHRSGRDVLVQAERGERILSVDQNKAFERMGGLGLLKKSFSERRIADSSSMIVSNNSDVVRELRELKEAVANKKEITVDWQKIDDRFERIESEIKAGMKTTTRFGR